MSVDTAKGCILIVISVSAGIPMFAWLILGGMGYLGDFSDTGTFHTIKYILIAVTCIFYFIVQPFFIWPRILNSEKDTKPSNTGRSSSSSR